MSRTRSPIRKDRHAVSPVIGTLLLVAMTVMLGATLYVALSGLLAPAPALHAMGVSIGRSSDGTNWTLSIVSTPTGLRPETVRLSVVSLTGELIFTKTFAELRYDLHGAVYVSRGGPAIASGDRILMDTLRYPTYFDVLIADETSTLFRGFLV